MRRQWQLLDNDNDEFITSYQNILATWNKSPIFYLFLHRKKAARTKRRQWQLLDNDNDKLSFLLRKKIFNSTTVFPPEKKR